MIFEKIRERLQKLCEQTYYNSVNGNRDEGIRNNAYHNAIDIINQVEAEYNNGWIKCEDKLPEPYKKVLVLEENGEIHLCRYHNESTRFYYDGSDWDIKLGCVTHWRELPQPPKGE